MSNRLHDVATTQGLHWLVDTISTGQNTYETLVVPCNEQGRFTSSGFSQRIIIRYDSEFEARKLHAAIVQKIKALDPEKVPALLEALQNSTPEPSYDDDEWER